MNTERMLQILRDQNQFTSTVLNATMASGLTYLFTIDPESLLEGKLGPYSWTPPQWSHAGASAAKHDKWPPPRPNMTTDAELAQLRKLISPMAQRWAGAAVRFFEVTNEANTFLKASEYLRVLRTISSAIRDAAPTSSGVQIVGGSVVNAFEVLTDTCDRCLRNVYDPLTCL
jgi:hypothetical protein